MIEARVEIRREADVQVACHRARTMAAEMGFSGVDQAIVIIAVSEVAHNQIDHADGGEIILRPSEQNDASGLCIVARDEGPGIPDVERALQNGYTTGKGLGLGLPGARRLVDEFEIASEVGKGTVVTIRQWRKQQ